VRKLSATDELLQGAASRFLALPFASLPLRVNFPSVSRSALAYRESPVRREGAQNGSNAKPR
jgi:hypothetical protein